MQPKARNRDHVGPRRTSFSPPTSNEDNSEGSWILSYGDMMTLVLCFFIIIASISTIDPSKLVQVSASVNKALKVDKELERPLDEIVEKLRMMVHEEKMEDLIGISYEKLKDARITFAGSFFVTGQATFQEHLSSMVDKVGRVLQEDRHHHFIMIEGHTDVRPIQSDKFPSNWELSAARASAVARELIGSGIAEDRVRVLGYGSTKPLQPSVDNEGHFIEENLAKNRRIEITLTRLGLNR